MEKARFEAKVHAKVGGTPLATISRILAPTLSNGASQFAAEEAPGPTKMPKKSAELEIGARAKRREDLAKESRRTETT
jgi:hypothetical protein